MQSVCIWLLLILLFPLYIILPGDLILHSLCGYANVSCSLYHLEIFKFQFISSKTISPVFQAMKELSLS